MYVLIRGAQSYPFKRTFLVSVVPLVGLLKASIRDTCAIKASLNLER